LTLKAGQLDSVVADLAAVIAAAPPVPEAPAELVTAPSEEGDGGSIGPWLVFGGAGAAALVGGVMAGLAQSDYDAALEVTGDPEAYTAHRNSYQTNRVVAGALFGLAGAAAVGGIVWWLLDGDDDEMPTAFGVLPTHEGVRGFAAWRF